MRRSGISSRMHVINLPFSPRHSLNEFAEWMKKVLDRFLACAYYKPKLKNYFVNAMKETLAKGNDRNTASPTESAVCGSWRREHSGAGDLNCRISHAARMTRCTR